MKVRFTTGFLSLALSTLLISCGGGEQRGGNSTASDTKPVSVKGSDTMVIMTQRLAEQYMQTNPGRVVQVNGGGSGTGIAALINGTADLAQASRPMKESEKSGVEKSRGAKVAETAIALDALGIFVHSSNPLKEITIEQARGLFSGHTKNWRELGGSDAPVVLYGRESSSGTYDYFREHVLEKGDFAPNVQTLQGTAAIMNAIAKDPNGVGYGGIAYATDVKALALKKDAASAAVAPSKETVADGSYPLSRKLFFYTMENAPARVREFVKWSLTPEAQALVAQTGYFPIQTTTNETSQ